MWRYTKRHLQSRATTRWRLAAYRWQKCLHNLLSDSPRYASVPVVRMGRLAVDQRYRGKKLGSALLWDAVLRATRSEIAAFALVVDAKDDAAANFYRYHGFVALDDEQRR